jgi:hypothetical protein
MDLIEIHTNECIDKLSFSRSAKALHEALTLTSSCSLVLQAEQGKIIHDQRPSPSQSLDTMLTGLSPSCFIISSFWASKSIQERVKILADDQRHYPLLTLRINLDLEPTDDPSQLQLQLQQHQLDTTNDQSLLNKFALLKIAPTQSNNTSNVTSKKVYAAMSQIIVREIISQFGTTDVLPVASVPRASDASRTKGMFLFSKRILHKASSVVTSFMESYDLSEDSHLHKKDQDVDHDDDDDEDDAIAFHDESVLDQDDAGGCEQGDYSSLSSRGFDVLLEQDIIWSVNIFTQCFKIITRHAEDVIRKKQDESDEDRLTEGIDPLNGQTVSGIILDRYGDKPCSFPSLCREAGYILEQKSQTGSKDEALAGILQNLRQGPGLEIILSCLLQSNKAKLSSNDHVVVLFPMANLKETIIEGCNFEVNEVDIAIFKITSAIVALERRTEVLGKRADEAQRKALAAKQAGNTNLALMHMKRRKMLLKEIENCSGSVLNLDGGLNSIQRAKSDAEVLKTYELMNNSMKTIRQESDLEKAEDIMIELQENKDDLDDFSTSLHGSVGHAISDEELEEELAQLMDNDEDEFIFHESTNGNDIANTNTELKKGGVGSVAGELEEELAQLMDNDGDVGISHESTNVNDIANINTELKEGGKVNVAGDDEEIELESQSPLAV